MNITKDISIMSIEELRSLASELLKENQKLREELRLLKGTNQSLQKRIRLNEEELERLKAELARLKKYRPSHS